MNIIKSDIINSEYDAFWEDISPVTKDAVQRPVLILVNQYEAGSTEEVQLMKMLAACELTTEQYNLITLQQDDKAAWHQLREKLNPKFIFLIGILPSQLGISSMFRLNEPNNFNDRIWLPTLSINELEQYKETKKQLWVNGISPVFINKRYGAI